jgi:hypothetical protein
MSPLAPGMFCQVAVRMRRPGHDSRTAKSATSTPTSSPSFATTYTSQAQDCRRNGRFPYSAAPAAIAYFLAAMAWSTLG